MYKRVTEARLGSDHVEDNAENTAVAFTPSRAKRQKTPVKRQLRLRRVPLVWPVLVLPFEPCRIRIVMCPYYTR